MHKNIGSSLQARSYVFILTYNDCFNRLINKIYGIPGKNIDESHKKVYNKEYGLESSGIIILEGDLMKLKTHMYIAETAITIIEQITGKIFNRRLVKIGACIPDIALNRRIKLHTPTQAGVQYDKMLTKFESGNRSKAFLSYMLGSYSHYVADSFCLAHNYYVTDLKKHVQYEALLQEKMYENTLPIDTVEHILSKSKSLNQNTALEYIGKEVSQYKKIISGMTDWDEMIDVDFRMAVINSAVLMLEFIYAAQAQPVLVPAA